MKVSIEKLQEESLLYNEYPYDTVIYSYPYDDCKSVYDFALVYRGYITAFGDEDGRSGGVTTDYKSGRLYTTLCWAKNRRPDFYEELKKYKLAPSDFAIDNPKLEEQIEQAKQEEARRQNEYRKGVLLYGMAVAKFALERELERLKKETSPNRSHAIQ